MKAAVFLDRDGTVIELFDHLVDPTEVKLIDVARQTVTDHSVVGREQHPRTRLAVRALYDRRVLTGSLSPRRGR